MISNQKFPCILDANESTRLRMEESLPNYHEDHIAGKKEQFITALEFEQKQQWIKNWKNLEKIPAWDLTKVRSKKEVLDEARTNSAKVHFASLMDI